MEDVELRHAKEHLEELVRRAARGEDVRITDPELGPVRLTLVTVDPKVQALGAPWPW